MENAGEFCVSDVFVELLNDAMDRELFELCEQIEHLELLFDSSYDVELYNQCAIIEYQLIQPQHVGQDKKRGLTTDENITSKKRRVNEGASTTAEGNNTVVESEICQPSVRVSYISNNTDGGNQLTDVINVEDYEVKKTGENFSIRYLETWQFKYYIPIGELLAPTPSYEEQDQEDDHLWLT